MVHDPHVARVCVPPAPPVVILYFSVQCERLGLLVPGRRHRETFRFHLWSGVDTDVLVKVRGR